MTKQINDRIIIHDIGEMNEYVSALRRNGNSIGLVPTMGALHEGHLSLVRRAAAESDAVIVSIFVNPIQFDDPADLTAYPRTLDTDAEQAFGAGACVVFAPNAEQMYPDGFSTFVDMTGISEILCGASRKSHFRGVLTVVAKLFGIGLPDFAYFGEKDAQQLILVQKMVYDLCLNVRIIGCPTVREEDGLAMSSRNSRLSGEERIAARSLYDALTEAKNSFVSGEKDTEVLRDTILDIIGSEPLARIEYAEIVDPRNLKTPEYAREGDLLMLAVHFGATRLIDNLRL